MPHAVSLHIGVNQPRQRSPGDALRHSETTAWRMAELAHQAGYRSLRVLQGAEATRQAVHDALAGAASTMRFGDLLFVSFSGHGTRVHDLPVERDERDGSDEAWCLFDGELVDDKLAGYWRLFDAGVRIVLVTESCYGGGMGRTWECLEPPPDDAVGLAASGVGTVPRGPAEAEDGAGAVACNIRAPRHADGIRASVLMLSACGEHQLARDGLFSGHLLDLWNAGKFEGSYYTMYERVRERVMTESCGQEPRIVMLGAPDDEFPTERAFRADQYRPRRRSAHG